MRDYAAIAIPRCQARDIVHNPAAATSTYALLIIDDGLTFHAVREGFDVADRLAAALGQA